MTSLASAQTARLAKRKAPTSESSDVWKPATALQKQAREPVKRAKLDVLDGWLGMAQVAPPELIVPSSEIIASDSTFLAHAAPCKSKAEALAFREHIRSAHGADPASHEMLAWRCMELREGRSGDHPSDFAAISGSDEDGEKWAGTHLLKVLEECRSVDAGVVCSRWFGGELLGPVRFQHIRTVAKEALENLEVALELDNLKEQILVKDATIAELAGPGSPVKPPNYDGLDVVKAKRLLLARDKRIELLTKLAKRAEQPADNPEVEGGGFVPEADVS